MRPPFFAFYPADFANDLHVEAMSTLQVGAYLLLLCKAWQGDPPASLPTHDQTLARYARVDAAVWAEIKAGVLAPFHLGADGRLHSKRLRREYDAALKRMKVAKESGSEGGRATQRAVKAARSANSQGTLEGSLEGASKGCLSGARALETGDRRLEKEEENTPLPPAEPGGGVCVSDTIPFEVIDTNLWPEFVAAWTAAGLPGAGKVQRTANRVGWLQQRLAVADWRARWRDAVARAGQSARCCGRVGGWRLNVEAFLKTPDMLVRILEGEFDDAPADSAKPAGSVNPKFAAVLARDAERQRQKQKPAEGAA